MTQQSLHRGPDAKQNLGLFSADLNVFGNTATYDIRVHWFPRSDLMQLDIRIPIAGWRTIAIADYAPGEPELLVLPDYKYVRGNPDAETTLLTQAHALLPTGQVPASTTVDADATRSGLFLA